MKRGLMVACFAAMLVAGRLADAAVINGQFVPDSLVNTPGAKYRVVFVTSGSISGTSGAIGTYTGFLTTQTNGTMLDNSSNLYNWKAIMSTADGLQIAANAVDLAGTADDYIPIYNTDGQLVASGSTTNAGGMLSGSLLAAVKYDQNGTSVANGFAWTGSFADGQPKKPPAAPADLRVGATMGTGGNSNIGLAESTNGSWLDAFSFPNGPNGLAPGIPFLARVYGISGVMTAVPEPSTIALWSICAGAVGLVAWRKRRKSS